MVFFLEWYTKYIILVVWNSKTQIKSTKNNLKIMKITQVLKSILFTIIAFHSISTSAQSTEYYSSVDDFIKKKKLEEFEFSLDTNSKNIRFYKNNNEF